MGMKNPENYFSWKIVRYLSRILFEKSRKNGNFQDFFFHNYFANPVKVNSIKIIKQRICRLGTVLTSKIYQKYKSQHSPIFSYANLCQDNIRNAEFYENFRE